jgi:separase
VTLRREMLDAIDAKLLRTSPPEDHLWPVLDAPPSTTASAESSAMINFWATVRERYASETVEATLTEPAFSRLLPVNWTIISIHLTRPDCLLLVRHQNSVEPLIFKLPLGRMAEREQADEEDDFTYGAASEELRTIIEESNALCQGAKNVNDKESRVGWWTERKSLDARLQALMESIETVWLGAFKVRPIPLFSIVEYSLMHPVDRACSPPLDPSRPSPSPTSRPKSSAS